MKNIFYLLAILFVTISTSNAEEHSPSMNIPKSELEVKLTRLSTPNTFHLSVKYCGNSSVLIVRPRAGMLDSFDAWGGWSLHVRSSEGTFHAPVDPGGMPSYTSLDLIELRSNESVGVDINLSNFTRYGKSKLVNLSGKYTVLARYHLEQDKVVLASGSANGEGFVAVPKLPAVESAVLQL
jgi:hypothetical protein